MNYWEFMKIDKSTILLHNFFKIIQHLFIKIINVDIQVRSSIGRFKVLRDNLGISELCSEFLNGFKGIIRPTRDNDGSPISGLMHYFM